MFCKIAICLKWITKHIEKFWQKTSIASITALFTAYILFNQLGIMQQQATIYQNQFGVMQGQLDESKAEQRPWIKVDVSIGGPLTYNINGAIITLNLQLTNVGHTPATHVWVNPRLIAYPVGDKDALRSYVPFETVQREMISDAKTKYYLSGR